MALEQTLVLKVTLTDNLYLGLPLCPGSYFDSADLEIEINWGDGTETLADVAPSVKTQGRTASHVYDSPGVKWVVIKGGYLHNGTRKLAFASSDDRTTGCDISNIERITQWPKFYVHGQGDFKGATKLQTVPNADVNLLKSADPLSSIVIGGDKIALNETFMDCPVFNGNLNSWNTTGCVSLNSTFKNATSFNKWIKNWDVSDVTTMASTFEGATNFNQDCLGDWRVDKVTDMSNLFKDCKFDGFIANWFRPNFGGRPGTFVIENMSGMFSGTSEMGKSEAGGNAAAGSKFMWRWKLDSVKDMSSMFKDNQHWNSWIQSWFKDESKTFAVTNMSRMFENSVFNLGLNWNVKSVEDMSYMFKDAAFNNFLCNWFRPAGGWNGNAPRNFAIKTIKGMFSGNCKYGADGDPKKGGQFLFRWDLQTVEDASEVFKDNQDWTHWIESWFKPGAGKDYNVTTMASMFENTLFDSNLGQWDMSKVTDISNMFKNAKFDKYIANWDLTSCKNVSGLFSGPNCKFKNNADTLWKWDMSAVEDASYMFKDNSEFNSTQVNTWFKQNNSNDRVFAIQSVKGMFEGNTAFNSPLNNWDLRTVTDASDMFKNNQTYTDASVTNLFKSSGSKTYQIQDMSGMFSETNLNPDLSTWDMRTVTSTKDMFKNNTGFNGWINNWFKQNAGGTKVFNIQDMSGMFEGSVQTRNISDWDVRTVVDMTNMFKNAQFDGAVHAWFKQNNDGDKAFACKNMTGMFSGSNCKFGESPQNQMYKWDMSGVERVDYMFHDNPHFNAWLSQWSVNGAKSNINFSNKSDWTTTPWIPNDRAGGIVTNQSKITDDLDINQSDISTGSIKIWDTDGLFDDLTHKTSGDPVLPGEVVISTQPTRGDVTLEFTGTNIINWSYTVDYAKGLAAGSDSFTLKYTDSNGYINEQAVTINLISEPWTTPIQAPAPDPVEIEFRWKEITVSDGGQNVNVTVLQAKNLLTPTHANWTNDTTGWWTLYGYAGDEALRSTYNLGSLTWPDAAAPANYGDFHSTSVTLPEGGTISITQGNNTGYLQLHYTPDGDYEFNGDVTAGNGELFLFFGDTDDDSGTVSPDWPLPRKKANAAPSPLVPATPQSDTGTGTVNGDLVQDLSVGPGWDGYIYGVIQLVDNTHGASMANGSNGANNGYVSIASSPAPAATNTTGSINADVYYEWSDSSLKYSFYTGDGGMWRGDGTFTIEWINDRSAQLQNDDANGNIPGGYASYNDTVNGVAFTAWNEGTDYNMEITADGTSEIWELIRDNGAWEGFEWEYDFSATTGATDPDEGWSTHVYPAGTIINITGGSDPGLQEGTSDYDIAYNEKNSIEIRLRVADATDGGGGTVGGDTDVTMEWTQVQMSGTLTFSDPDGVSKLSDSNYGGWFSTGSMAKPNTTPRGTFDLRKNSIYDVGKYDYVADTSGSFPYVDEFQVTWQDDLGFTNTSDVKFTVNNPSDSVGTWQGDTVINVDGQNPSEWVDPNDDPDGEAYYVQTQLNLTDNDGLTNNSPTITVTPTKGTVEMSHDASNGEIYVDYYAGQNAGFNGAETDTVTIEWEDNLGYTSSITLTYNIAAYVDIFANPTGTTATIDAWSATHPTNNIPTGWGETISWPNIGPEWYMSLSTTQNGPLHGSVQSYGGASWYYQVNDGVSDVTDTWEMTWSAYNNSTYQTKYTTTTISVVVNELPAVVDTPGSTTGSSDLTGTVNSNNNEFDNNQVTGNLYYTDDNGTTNSGTPEAITTLPTRGNVSINYGQWTYTPNEGESGADSFVVEWTDDQGFNNYTTVNITIVDTSDKASNITGQTNATADAMPLDWHSGNSAPVMTGTVTVTDDNGFDNGAGVPYMDNTSGIGTASIVSSTLVDGTTIMVEWSYTPVEQETGDITHRVNWTDAHGHNGYVGITTTLNTPAAVDRTINSSSPDLEAEFNNQGTPSYDISNGDGDATFEIVSTQGAPQLVGSYDGYNVTITESTTLNTYDVTVSLDTGHNWPVKAPGSPQAAFSETLNLAINDGFGRVMTPLTVNVSIRAFVDSAGTISLVDPGNGQDNLTDVYGQQIITDSGVSSLKLFYPAPQGTGILSGIVFTDVAGVGTVSTVTVDQVDSSHIEVLTTDVLNGYLTLETTGLGLGSGSFNVNWTDDLGNVNVSPIAYEVVALPDIAGTVVEVKDADDVSITPTNDTYILPASYVPVAFTVTVDDANGIGPATVVSQPADGSFTIISQGGGYLATYTPPLSTEKLGWGSADMSFKWEDADGNENDTVSVRFEQQSPAYTTPWTGTNGEARIDVTIDGADEATHIFSPQIAPIGSYDGYYGRPYEVQAGSTITGQLAIYDHNGIPYPDNALLYSQPILSDGTAGGSLQLVENTTDDLNANFPDHWSGQVGSYLPKDDPAQTTTRMYDLSYTAPSVIPNDADYVDLSINFRVISFRGTGRNEIDIADWDDQPDYYGEHEKNYEQDLKLRVYKGAGSYLELEYSEPVDVAHIPPHDGTAVAVGNKVQVTGFTQFGGDVGSSGDRYDTAQKLIAVNQFGPGNNIDWEFAFHQSANLVHVPSVMPAASNIDHMFMGCTSLTEIIADRWDTSNLTSLKRVFLDCSNLTKLYVREWDVSNVTDFTGLFHGTGFTSLDDIVGLMPNSPTGWDFSSAESFAQMFQDSKLSGHVEWTNTQMGSNLTNLNHMFYKSSDITQVTMTGFYDSDSVTTMKGMFQETAISQLTTSNMDTSNVTDMSDMFKGVTSSQINLVDIDVTGVTDASSMFEDTTNMTTMTFTPSNVAAFTSITSPAGFTDMFKNSGVVNPGLDLSNWYTPNLSGTAGDLLGENVTINSNWELNLEMGGNPGGHVLVPPTVSVIDSTEPNSRGKSFKLANYEHPSASDVWLDWRRDTLIAGIPGAYMLVKVSNNGTTLNFLAAGSWFRHGAAGMDTSAGHWNTSYSNVDGGNHLYFHLTNTVKADGFFEKTYDYISAGDPAQAVGFDPEARVFLDSKPTWVSDLGDVDHANNINKSKWLGLGTPTRAQVNAMLPADGNDNIKITIEVHELTGTHNPITVLDQADIKASDFADALQFNKIGVNANEMSEIVDDSNLTNWANDPYFRLILPYSFARAHIPLGADYIKISQPVGNATLTADNAAQFIAGSLDSSLPATGSLQPAEFVLNYIRSNDTFASDWNELIDSCFFPEFNITIDSVNITNNVLKTKLAGISLNRRDRVVDALTDNDYTSVVGFALASDQFGMDGKQGLFGNDGCMACNGGSIITISRESNWYEDYPINDFNVSVVTSTKYTDTTQNILYGGSSRGEVDMSTQTYTDSWYGFDNPTVRSVVTTDKNYAEFEWTSNTSKVLIPEIAIPDANFRRMYDFDPDGTAGLTASERFYIYEPGYPNISAVNVPSGMKGAIPLRPTDWSTPQSIAAGPYEPIPGFAAQTQSWVDTYGLNDVWAAVDGLSTINLDTGLGNQDDSMRYTTNGQAIFEYTDSAKPRKVRIYDEVGAPYPLAVGQSDVPSIIYNIISAQGAHQPEFGDVSSIGFHAIFSQNVSYISTLGVAGAVGSVDANLRAAGEWQHRADTLDMTPGDGIWYWYARDHDTIGTKVTDLSQVP